MAQLKAQHHTARKKHTTARAQHEDETVPGPHFWMGNTSEAHISASRGNAKSPFFKPRHGGTAVPWAAPFLGLTFGLGRQSYVLGQASMTHEHGPVPSLFCTFLFNKVHLF